MLVIKIKVKCNTTVTMNLVRTHWIQLDIDQQKVYFVFCKITENKAVGPDKIYNEMLLHYLPVIMHLLLLIYNSSWQLGHTPKLWRLAY